MTRRGEFAFLAAASVLVGYGTAFVNLSRGQNVDAEVGLSFLVFGLAFAGLYLGIKVFAPRATVHPLLIAAALGAIGFVEVYRLDPRLGSLQRWWFLIAAALAVGLLALLRDQGLDLLRRYRFLMLASALILLLLPLLPLDGSLPIRGRLVNGSRLWVTLGWDTITLGFQPGEIAKLLLVAFLAAFLSDNQAALSQVTHKLGGVTIPDPRQLMPVAIAWVASFAVMIAQRDLGASLLLFAAFITLLYAATGQVSYLGIGGGLFLVGGVVAWRVFDHVQVRISAWLQPFEDPFGSGYQIVQGLYAMGSGSLTGAGLGLGRPDLIPFAATDFIYAAVGEELGLAGSVVVIALYGLMVAAGAGIALRSRNQFRRLFAAGLTFIFGIQTILIIGGIVRLLPLTGITLPFMSYGGSSLVANFMLLALLARISHEERV